MKRWYLPLSLVALIAVWLAPIEAVLGDDKPAKRDAAPPSWLHVEKNIAYVPGGDPAQALDLYLPTAPSDKPLPLLVWIHGGGWRGGNKNGCRWTSMVQHGYIAASIEYRFSNKALFPAQIQDCQAAIRWLRANSKKYNIDPDHIGIGGDSAGGHLVALLGTSGGKKAFPPIGGNEDQSDRVQAVCDFYGPTDFSDVMAQAEDEARTKNVHNIFKFNTPSDPYSGLIGAPLDSDKEKTLAVSPVHYVSKDNPPFLILHGTADTLVPFSQSVELTDDLKKAGVEVILQPIPGGGHGGPGFGLPAVNKLIGNFFGKYLKGEDVKVEALPDADVTPPVKPVKK